MEHRYCVRIGSNLPVVLYQQRIPIAIGKLRDICRCGLFVDTLFDDIDRHQPLMVEIRSRTVQNRYRFCVVVAHKASDGLGLAMHEHRRTGRNVLARLMADRSLDLLSIALPESSIHTDFI